MDAGRTSSDSAPVEDRTTFSSMAKPGTRSGREPVATMIVLASMVEPSAWPPLNAIPPRPRRVPRAMTTSTLFFFRSAATPRASVSAASRDLACTRP